MFIIVKLVNTSFTLYIQKKRRERTERCGPEELGGHPSPSALFYKQNSHPTSLIGLVSETTF